MVDTEMHYNVRPPDVEPVLVGFHYEARNAPARSKINTSTIDFAIVTYTEQ